MKEWLPEFYFIRHRRCAHEPAVFPICRWKLDLHACTAGFHSNRIQTTNLSKVRRRIQEDPLKVNIHYGSSVYAFLVASCEIISHSKLVKKCK